MHPLPAVCAGAAGAGQGAGRRGVHLGAGPGPGLFLRPPLGPSGHLRFPGPGETEKPIQPLFCFCLSAAVPGRVPGPCSLVTGGTVLAGVPWECTSQPGQQGGSKTHGPTTRHGVARDSGPCSLWVWALQQSQAPAGLALPTVPQPLACRGHEPRKEPHAARAWGHCRDQDLEKPDLTHRTGPWEPVGAIGHCGTTARS